MRSQLDNHFPRYELFGPRIPIWCITPHLKGCVHRFYDSSPFSPSGRFVALTRLPFEDRLPGPGEPAEIILVDLQDGTTQIIGQTFGWDTQLGAQVQWGKDDDCLLFNDVDTDRWRPYGVQFNHRTGARSTLGGTVYMASPDGAYAASPCLARLPQTQRGYGVMVPAEYVPNYAGASEDDGLFLTDLVSGECRLVASFARIVREAIPRLDAEDCAIGSLSGFHVKWNPQGTRLMFVMRQSIPGQDKVRSTAITMRPDGSDIRVALHWNKWRGHHPNWYPDGENIVMNLKVDNKILRLARFAYDGRNLSVIANSVPGSGHPTVHPNGRILTDAKPKDGLGSNGGLVPLRWIDSSSGDEITLAEIPSQSTAPDEPALRVDLHPAWDRNYRMIAFNGSPDGTRRVFVADMFDLV